MDGALVKVPVSEWIASCRFFAINPPMLIPGRTAEDRAHSLVDIMLALDDLDPLNTEPLKDEEGDEDEDYDR